MSDDEHEEDLVEFLSEPTGGDEDHTTHTENHEFLSEPTDRTESPESAELTGENDEHFAVMGGGFIAYGGKDSERAHIEAMLRSLDSSEHVGGMVVFAVTGDDETQYDSDTLDEEPLISTEDTTKHTTEYTTEDDTLIATGGDFESDEDSLVATHSNQPETHETPEPPEHTPIIPNYFNGDEDDTDSKNGGDETLVADDIRDESTSEPEDDDAVTQSYSLVEIADQTEAPFGGGGESLFDVLKSIIPDLKSHRIILKA
jgi:hypothetical protein